MEKRGLPQDNLCCVNEVHKRGLSAWSQTDLYWKRVHQDLVAAFINEVVNALLEKAILSSNKSYKTLSTRNAKEVKINVW